MADTLRGDMLLVLTPLLFGLSFLSGMMGLGVAFVAVPVLGLFGYDLKDVIQPWTLLLNGLTAISGAIAFWRAGMVDRRGALILVIITTIGAPLGVWLLQFASTDFIWWLYVAVLVFLAIRMAMPKGASTEDVGDHGSVAGQGERRRRADLGLRGLPRSGPGLPAHADARSRRLQRPPGGRDQLGCRHAALVLGLREPLGLGAVRLADSHRHLGRLGHRRLARSPFHGGTGEERDAFPNLRHRARCPRRAARLDPPLMTTRTTSANGMPVEVPDAR